MPTWLLSGCAARAVSSPGRPGRPFTHVAVLQPVITVRNSHLPIRCSLLLLLLLLMWWVLGTVRPKVLVCPPFWPVIAQRSQPALLSGAPAATARGPIPLLLMTPRRLAVLIRRSLVRDGVPARGRGDGDSDDMVICRPLAVAAALVPAGAFPLRQ